MILFANFLNAVASILHVILMIYMWILVIRAVLSWIHVPSLYQVKVILFHLTEPVLAPLRRLVPPYKFGGLDITPILAFILILFIDSFLVKSLSLYAQQILRQHGTYSF
jgi:YggT family protein